MQRAREGGARDLWLVERAVVLQALRDDHAARWSRAELASQIPDFAPAVFAAALERLEHAGVVRLDGSRVSASAAARRLDELELIAV
jgi:Elongation factor SelB, winged helix